MFEWMEITVDFSTWNGSHTFLLVVIIVGFGIYSAILKHQPRIEKQMDKIDGYLEELYDELDQYHKTTSPAWTRLE